MVAPDSTPLSDSPTLAMNPKTALRPTLLLAVPVLAGATFALEGRGAERVVFAPQEGTKVTKTFENTMAMTLDNMDMLMNGEEAPMMGDMQMEMNTIQRLSVVDEYVKMGEGRPATLRRTFDEVAMEMDMDISMEVMGTVQEQSPTGTGTSALEGKTVVFELEDGTYVKTYPEGEEGAVDVLDGLAEDLDLRGLLPTSGSAEVGESWDIALPGLIDIFAPGGDLAWEIEMDGMGMGGPGGMDPGMMSQMREFFGEQIEGEARGTLTEIREADGARIAVIDLLIEIDTSADMSELMSEQMANNDQMPPGMEIVIDRADMEFRVESSGQLLWNLTAGHAVSLELEGDNDIAQDVEMSMDMQGQAIDMEMAMEMTGTTKTSVRFE